MSKFKDLVKADIKNVFMNNNEFADLHMINGIEMSIIIDEDGLEEYKSLQRIDSEGLYLAKMLIHVDCDDLGYRPAINSTLKVDKIKYFVMNVADNAGMYHIMLGVNRA